MIIGKLVGFRNFVFEDKDTGKKTNKVTVCFSNPDIKAEFGQIAYSYNFKSENCPSFTDKDLGKEIIVDIGSFNNKPYGKAVLFK